MLCTASFVPELFSDLSLPSSGRLYKPSMASIAPTTSVFSMGGFHSRRGDLRSDGDTGDVSAPVSGSVSRTVPPAVDTLPPPSDSVASGEMACAWPPVKSALNRSGRFLSAIPPPRPLRAHERSSDPYPSTKLHQNDSFHIEFLNAMPCLTDIAGGFTFPGSISVSGSAEVIHKRVIIFFGWNSAPAAAQTSVGRQILWRMKQN